MRQQKLPSIAKSFFASEYFINNTQKNILLIVADEEETIKLYKQLLFFAPNVEILYFPSMDTVPYDSISPSSDILSARANVLSHLATNDNRKLVVTNAANLLVKLPPVDFFTKASLRLYKNMQLTIQQLVHFLVHHSFTRSASAIDSGEFALRGEIIDVVLLESRAYRINFSWNQIESIRQFDIESQISTTDQKELIISAHSEIILNSKTISNFTDHYLKNFGVNHTNIPLYEAIISGRKFPGYEHLLPLFYSSFNMLTDYLNHPTIIYDNLSLQSIFQHEHNYKDFYQARIESDHKKLNMFHPILSPEQVCFASKEVETLLKQEDNIFINPQDSSYAHSLEKITVTSFIEKKTVFDKLFEIITRHNKKKVIILCPTTSGLARLKNIIVSYSYQYYEIDKLQDAKMGIINLAAILLDQGFYSDKYLFIPAQDIFGEKLVSYNARNAKSKLKNLLIELDNLSEGEFVVHKDHGIGQFINIETLDIDGKAHDFLKILYANNDKLYIPVENIEIIKKYGSSEAQLDKLGSASWQKNKARLKNHITEIAQQLLQMVAQRKLAISSPIEFDLIAYDQFCHKFHYTETDDQMNAINDIKNDLNSDILMDRLICGDVGFGKTEVAMRAAFMVAKSIHDITPQVAIVVPTTILCKQHYARFLDRFNGFDLNIVQLSSLVTNAKISHEQIKNGVANIIIGTHALLSPKIEFQNLKLLIIDEEQHFGVQQKEYLKTLKSSTHVLSLSATPIPRTLQMSMVGLKELSIIAMPPMDRLEVRTMVMKFDPVIIRDALLKEHFRGGRSFYVVPRIKDIAAIEIKLKKITPELKYKIVHGQMLPSIVDKIMSEFRAGQFDVLISTTIIESGIDIAEANTMIIHNADMLGLSQLYQLRGRIGRSRVRAYAYLTLTKSEQMTKHAIKRLEIMQNSCSLGSGFTIASHDMDLRGFGNLVGKEQSGQIREVGVELYQEMLDEQIAILKNEANNEQKCFIPTINLGLPIFIDDNYIPDSSLKLAIYRRIGNLVDHSDIENFRDEMIDRFGPIPLEFNNLLNIIQIKQICSRLNIENLNSTEQGFVLKFHKEANIADMIIKFVSKYPYQAKIKLNNKLVFTKTLVRQNIIEETNQFLAQLSMS